MLYYEYDVGILYRIMGSFFMIISLIQFMAKPNPARLFTSFLSEPDTGLFRSHLDDYKFPAESSKIKIHLKPKFSLPASLMAFSARKMQEAALRESETRFQQLFARSPFGIFIADLNGRFIQANAAFQAFTGYQENDLSGMPYWELIHPEDRDETITLFDELRQAKRTCYEKESRCVRKDGSTAWGAMIVSVLDGTDRKHVSILGMVKDINDRIQAEAALDMYSKHLEELVELRSAELEESRSKLYEQAHELAVRKERQRLARELHDSVTQLLYSMNLLNSGWRKKAEEGQMVDPAAAFQQLESIGLQALKEMRLVIYQMRPPILEENGLVGALRLRLEAVEQHVNIHTELVTEGDLPPLSQFVEEQLYDIAQEALNNTLRHAQADRIFVQILYQDGHLDLTIQDNGQGFTLENISKGMGLDTMRERAEAIASQLQVTSDLQEGTKVHITVAV